MSKKKANIYTALLAILITVAWLATFALHITSSGKNLFAFVGPYVCGLWTAERMAEFRNWLMRKRG